MYRTFFKPFFDKIASLLILIVLSPVLILVIVLVAIANRGQVWFFQQRPGQDEKLFRVIKFKTMNDKRDKNGELLPDEERLTSIGKIIRKTSLDELPQLVNVLKGDMSIVGPRPLLVSYLDYYNETQKKRHLVKPGITGWSQVNGRNLLNWDKRLEFDVWYVENQSFLLDIKILIKTILKVLLREGISPEGRVTMPTFIEFLETNKNKNER